jgi:hypothetical protein
MKKLMKAAALSMTVAAAVAPRPSSAIDRHPVHGDWVELAHVCAPGTKVDENSSAFRCPVQLVRNYGRDGKGKCEHDAQVKNKGVVIRPGVLRENFYFIVNCHPWP